MKSRMAGTPWELWASSTVHDLWILNNRGDEDGVLMWEREKLHPVEKWLILSPRLWSKLGLPYRCFCKKKITLKIASVELQWMGSLGSQATLTTNIQLLASQLLPVVLQPDSKSDWPAVRCRCQCTLQFFHPRLHQEREVGLVRISEVILLQYPWILLRRQETMKRRQQAPNSAMWQHA